MTDGVLTTAVLGSSAVLAAGGFLFLLFDACPFPGAFHGGLSRAQGNLPSATTLDLRSSGARGAPGAGGGFFLPRGSEGRPPPRRSRMILAFRSPFWLGMTRSQNC